MHYEPQESPFRNVLYGQQRNPVRQVTGFRHSGNRLQPGGAEPGAGVFPYVATTYRLTEHHTAGGALLGRRNRAVAAISGAALLAASAVTRWGIFHAGLASAADPKYTVIPQRQRRDGTAPSAHRGPPPGS